MAVNINRQNQDEADIATVKYNILITPGESLRTQFEIIFDEKEKK